VPDPAPQLIELLQNDLAGIDAQFEFWLTITFAVVVASHLARDQLTLPIRAAIAVLYSFAVVFLVSRLLGHVEGAQFISAALTDLGVDYPRSVTSLNAPLVGWLRRALMLAGSLAAIAFVLRGLPFKRRRDAPEGPD
jgi:hypothetical protein